MDSPTPNDNGKIVDCVVLPKYGKSLRRRFTLSYVDGKEASDCISGLRSQIPYYKSLGYTSVGNHVEKCYDRGKCQKISEITHYLQLFEDLK